MNTIDPKLHDNSILDSLASENVNWSQYQNSDYNYKYYNLQNTQNLCSDLSPSTTTEDVKRLQQNLNSTELESNWKQLTHQQSDKVSDLEKEIHQLKKDLRRAHKKIMKYKQLKEHSDMELQRQSENQKESMGAQTAKMKELFLKEYEELIIEKNNEIKYLTSELNTSSSDNKDLQFEIKGKFILIL